MAWRRGRYTREDESLLDKGWCVHDGEFAKRHGLPGNDPGWSGLSGTGFRFGMAQRAVYPPAAAAAVPEAIVSL